MSKCESCEDFPVTVEMTDIGTTTYKICNNCLFELVNHALTNQHFKNLLKNGHSSSEYYLHDDFYDEDGNAIQPML